MKNVKGKMTKNQEKDKIAESTIYIFVNIKVFYESLDKKMRHVSTQMRKKNHNVTKSCDFPWFEAFVNHWCSEMTLFCYYPTRWEFSPNRSDGTLQVSLTLF